MRYSFARLRIGIDELSAPLHQLIHRDANVVHLEADMVETRTAALEKALAETALDLSISRAINATYERKVGPLAPGKSTT